MLWFPRNRGGGGGRGGLNQPFHASSLKSSYLCSVLSLIQFLIGIHRDGTENTRPFSIMGLAFFPFIVLSSFVDKYKRCFSTVCYLLFAFLVFLFSHFLRNSRRALGKVSCKRWRVKVYGEYQKSEKEMRHFTCSSKQLSMQYTYLLHKLWCFKMVSRHTEKSNN